MSRPPDLRQSLIKVVVLVLENAQGDILLTQRKKGQHLAGCWEFPGGKVEVGESAIEALNRECREELNYQISTAKKILDIQHKYPDIAVKLSVYQEFNTNPHVEAAENQAMMWIKKTALTDYEFPAANQSIIKFLLNQQQ